MLTLPRSERPGQRIKPRCCTQERGSHRFGFLAIGLVVEHIALPTRARRAGAGRRFERFALHIIQNKPNPLVFAESSLEPAHAKATRGLPDVAFGNERRMRSYRPAG